MLYGSVAMLALLSCLYLRFRRSNVIAPGVEPPRSLRRWAGAFMASVAGSHAWWCLHCAWPTLSDSMDYGCATTMLTWSVRRCGRVWWCWW